MTWWAWLIVAGLAALSFLFFLGCRAACRRARGIARDVAGAEYRIKKMLAGFNDKLEGEGR